MILKKILAFCGQVFGSKPVKKSPVKKIKSKQYNSYPPEKQKKLQQACERLFEQRELIGSGRLQMLGLGKIKRKFGKSWAGLQVIVYETVEEAISKYMMPADIFIRYQDDSYVIVFANAGYDEAQIKMTLIAEEIKRKLFEHEEEALREIDVKESVQLVETKTLAQHNTTEEKIQDIAQQFERPAQHKEKQTKNPPPPPSSMLDIDPYANKQTMKTTSPNDDNQEPMHYTYVPLWDTKKNLLTTYLCLAQDHKVNDDPFDSHQSFFMGMSLPAKAKWDLEILKRAINDLNHMSTGNKKLFLACPVHYETLTNAKNFDTYILECQKILPQQKKFLIFFVLNLPDNFTASNVQRFSKKLKTHCHHLFTQVPFNLKTDFSLIRECGFDAVGIRLKRSSHSEKKTLDMMDSFCQNAKKAFISKVFAMDVTSLSIATSATCSDFDFLAGPTIHEHVEAPDNLYRFQYEDLFEKLISEQEQK